MGETIIIVMLVGIVVMIGVLLANQKRDADHVIMIIDDLNRQIALLSTLKASALAHPVQKVEPERTKGDTVPSKRAFMPIARLRAKAVQGIEEQKDATERRIAANVRAFEG